MPTSASSWTATRAIALRRACPPDRLRRRLHGPRRARRPCSTPTRRLGELTTYKLTLPTEPPTRPSRTGQAAPSTSRTASAFWFGLALCDDQSAPNPGGSRCRARTFPARRTATRTSTTAPTRATPTTSASTPARPSWSCSSTRRAGCTSSRPASVATRPSGAPRLCHLPAQPEPEHRQVNNADCLSRSWASSRPNFAFITRDGSRRRRRTRSTRRARRSTGLRPRC